MVQNKSFKNFILIWIGELISCIGSGMTAFALGVYVFKLTHMASSVALVTLCAFLPSILLSPIGGVFADRFDRRLMMIIGDLVSAFGLIFILLMMWKGQAELWHICLGVTFSSVFVALLEPSYKATVTDLLTEEQFGKASGLVQLANASKYLLSPVIAGVLLAVADVKTVLLVDICTFFVTVLLILIVKRHLSKAKVNREKHHLIKELREGWDAITIRKGVLALIILISMVTFYIGFLQTLLTPMILAFSNSKVLGTVQSVSAIGMLVSSFVIGVFDIKKDMRKVMVLWLAFAGVFVSLMGMTVNIYIITVFGFLFFFALPYVNTTTEVLIRKNIDNEKQGRAWGLIGVISQLGYVMAYCVSGILADYIFNPMLVEGGILASSLGRIIGVGQGRGIGLLFVVSGVMVIITAVVISRIASIKELEDERELSQAA